MKYRVQVLVLVLAGASLVPAGAHAQASETWDSVTFVRLQASLDAHERVRVSIATGQLILYHPHLESAAVHFDSAPGLHRPAVLSLTQIRSVEVPHGRAARFGLEGFVAGAALGTVGGFFSILHGHFGGCLGATPCKQGFTLEGNAGDVARIAAVTAVAGALLGALIGASSPDWKLVFPVR